VNNLVATVRPDYPGLNKPVVAAQPGAATSLPRPPNAAPPQAPSSTGDPETGGVAVNEKQSPARTTKAGVTTTAAVPGK